MFWMNDWGRELSSLIPGLPFYLKGLFSLLCTIAVWTTGRYMMDREDHRWLAAAFLFTAAGDIGFIIPEVTGSNPTWLFLLSMLLYGVFQVLSIIRYTRNLETRKDLKGILPLRLIMALVLTGTLVLILYSTSGSLIRGGLLIPVVIYGSLLITSAWFGINTLTLKRFPQVNAWLIAAGVVLIFFGDSCEAWKLGVSDNPQLLYTAKRMTWIFYGPAITLLSLSGFRWDERGTPGD
jgi:H+/Cl- antiporter ClcA